MKILHVVFTENVGGIERAYVNLHGLLHRFGHHVVALAVPRFPFLAEIEGEVRFARPHGVYDFLELTKLAFLLWCVRPDLIITHNSRATQIMNYVRKVYPTPLLAFAHSRKRRRLRGADAVCVLTETMKQQFIAEGFRAERLHIVPNTLMSFPETLLPFAPEKTPVTLGFMGRFDKVKGLNFLLDALLRLKEKGRAIKLHIAGNGTPEEVAQVKHFLATHHLENAVQLLGWVKDIRMFLAEVDALVVPSFSETFGLVVLEAQAHGRVVIASATDGPSSLIEDGKTGYLFAKGDAAAIADAVERALNERPLWPEMVEQAREAALRYQPEYIEQQVKHVLDAMPELQKQ